METIDLTTDQDNYNNHNVKRQRLDESANYVDRTTSTTTTTTTATTVSSFVLKSSQTQFQVPIAITHPLAQRAIVIRDLFADTKKNSAPVTVSVPFLSESLTEMLLCHCEIVEQYNIGNEPPALLTEVQIADMHRSKWFQASLELVRKRYTTEESLIELIMLCHTCFYLDLQSLFHVTAYEFGTRLSEIKDPLRLVKLFEQAPASVPPLIKT